MPRKLSNVLTPLQVKSLPSGRHTDGGGLQLLVKKSGARSWVFRFMIGGKSRDVGLGPASGTNMITLADARDLAIDLRRKVRAGIDPLHERTEATAALEAKIAAAEIAKVSFRDVAEAYVTAHSDNWRNSKHRAQWASTLKNYVYPVMGDMPVGEIQTEHVMAVIEPIWKTKSETASRIRGRIETILDSAKARGYRQGENPARWRGHIALMLPARTRLSRGHHRALPYKNIPKFIAALQSQQATAALALEFTILTASRSGEVLGATWQEVDFAEASWTVPAARMKAGKEHRVPLTQRAVDIVKTMQVLETEHIFTGLKGRELSNMAMSMVLRRMEVEATVHGFRSGFRDWAAETTSISHEVCEMALAHVIANKAEAAYRRGDLFAKRRDLMETWAEYCGSAAA